MKHQMLHHSVRDFLLPCVTCPPLLFLISTAIKAVAHGQAPRPAHDFSVWPHRAFLDWEPSLIRFTAVGIYSYLVCLFVWRLLVRRGVGVGQATRYCGKLRQSGTLNGDHLTSFLRCRLRACWRRLARGRTRIPPLGNGTFPHRQQSPCSRRSVFVCAGNDHVIPWT